MLWHTRRHATLYFLSGMLLMVQCTCARPSMAQLRFLLSWAYADAAAAAARPAAFGLLRAVLTRRLVLPEVYDLMGRVQSGMVQAQVRVGRTSHLLSHQRKTACAPPLCARSFIRSTARALLPVRRPSAGPLPAVAAWRCQENRHQLETWT